MGFFGFDTETVKDTTENEESVLLRWEEIKQHSEGRLSRFSKIPAQRAKVPGGWLVLIFLGDGSTPVFVPDADHSWNKHIDDDQ